MGLVPIASPVPGGQPQLRSITIPAPAAPGVATVHAAVTLPATGTTTVSTAITNPDVPRNVVIKGNASGIAGNVVVNGTDANGVVIAETIALNGSATVVGAKAFATVTSFVVPAKTNSSGDTCSIGCGSVLGLGVILSRDTMVHSYLNGALEGTRATLLFDATHMYGNTVLLNSSIPGSQDVIIDCYL